jgi:hypothetical protein
VCVRRALALLALVGAGCDRTFALIELDEWVPDAAIDAQLVGCLTDDFTAPTVDGMKWTVLESAAHVSQTGGVLEVALAQTKGVNYAAIASAARDMTNDSVSIELVGVPNPLTFAEGGLTMQLDIAHRYQIFTTAGLLIFRLANEGDNDTSTAFDPGQHRFLRLRDAGGTIAWETSSDRATWITHRTVLQAFPTTSVSVYVFGGTFQQESAAPGTAQFDNLIVDCR